MITLRFNYQDKDYKYRIAGFFETTMMGTNNIGIMKFMLPETSYQTLADELDDQSKAIDHICSDGRQNTIFEVKK